MCVNTRKLNGLRFMGMEECQVLLFIMHKAIAVMTTIEAPIAPPIKIKVFLIDSWPPDYSRA